MTAEEIRRRIYTLCMLALFLALPTMTLISCFTAPARCVETRTIVAHEMHWIAGTSRRTERPALICVRYEVFHDR